MRNVSLCSDAFLHARRGRGVLLCIVALFSVFVAAASGALWASTTPQIAAGGVSHCSPEGRRDGLGVGI